MQLPRDIRRDESGMTLVELLVATSAGMIVFFGLTMMVVASMHETTRITTRVHSTQNARTALHRVVSELHSACLAQYATPILEESTSSKLAFIHSYSAEVTPTPTKSVITLSGSTLTQTDYAYASGTAPEWTFNSTASSTRAIMSGVSAISGSVPLFTYSELKSGVMTAIPLSGTTTLGSSAERTVKVDVALKVSPPGATVTDSHGAAQVKDSAYLRFTAPGYTTTSANLPCE